MDDQMRILIQDHNRMEEKLKQELHSVKLQLNHSIKSQTYSEIAIDHDPTNVPSSEEDLELAELARQKMHEKMNDPVCVEKRIKYIPPNYSKENFLATFTPQTQLTPEQVFWSIDLEKRKAEELKANTPPLPVLPPATDFEKTCKKRITPTGITEGERGFEQTKRCYLTEVIPFFNLLKEHFDSVQKSLVTEVRAMKAVFENMEAEVDQNAVDKKCGEIERRNLLIMNENLIAECLFSDMHDAFTIAQKRIADLESENFNLRNKIQNDDHDSMIKHFSKLEVEHFNLQLKYQNLKERFGNKKPVTSSDAPSFDSLFVIGKLNEQIQSRGNTIRELKEKISRLTEKNSDADPTLDLKALVSQNKDLTAKLNALHDLNERFRAEKQTVKHIYKELYDSIKITHAKTNDQKNSLLTEIENLKTQLKGKMPCVTIDVKTPKVSAFEKYAIDVEPIPPRQRSNRNVHHGYLNSLKDTLDTLREIVEEARSELPSDSNLDYACVYTKRSQELLANASACDVLNGNNTPKHVKQQSVQPTNVPILPSTGVNTATIASGSKPRSNTKKDKTLPAKSVPKKKVEDHPRNNKSKLSKKNRVDSCTSVRSTVCDTNSNSLCKTCNECINSDSHDKCVDKSLKFSKPTPVRKIWRVKQVKQTWQPTGKLFTTVGHHWKPTGRTFPLGAQCPLTRKTTPKVVPVKIWKPTGRIIPLRGQCPLTRPTALTSRTPTGRTLPLGAQCPLTRKTTPKVVPVKIWKPTGRRISNPLQVKQVWKATRKLFTTIGHQWRPTGRLLPLKDQWPLPRNTLRRSKPRNIPPKVLPTRQWKPTGRLLPLGRQCPLVRSTALKSNYLPADPQETIVPVVQIVLWYLDSGCSKHMTGDRSRLRNFVKKFIGTVRFGNDHFGAIIGYGDYVIGDSVISRVYYVEGLGHNLFSVGQFCDSDLEVAFRKHTCFVRDLEGVDLIKGSRGTNLYTISVEDMMRSSPICLLSKASKNKSWLWHRRLNHLNFGTLNDLARKDLVRGLPRLKFEKDHLCSACQLGKSRKATHKPKTINTITEVLHTLHMDLCGPLRVQSINGKKYILVIVEDYSRFTWVKFLRSKDETPVFAPLFLWAEAMATACYTQNRSLIHTLHNKTPYELVHGKKPDLSFLRIFRALCYPTNDSEDLGKLKAKADIGFFDSYIILLLLFRMYPPTNKDLELLFQPMFDEYFETPTGDHQMPHVLAIPPLVIPTYPSVSISFNHDAPSSSYSPSSLAHQSSSVHHDVVTEHSLEVNLFAATEHKPFVNMFAPDPTSEASSFGTLTIPTPNQSTQPHEHLRKWTDSHPLDNIIRNPS
ncbi:retrovirus-related pol polyprotein from transposon TNT 1-94 [Tanacetum coccineum]